MLWVMLLLLKRCHRFLHIKSIKKHVRGQEVQGRSSWDVWDFMITSCIHFLTLGVGISTRFVLETHLGVLTWNLLNYSWGRCHRQGKVLDKDITLCPDPVLHRDMWKLTLQYSGISFPYLCMIWRYPGQVDLCVNPMHGWFTCPPPDSAEGCAVSRVTTC